VNNPLKHPAAQILLGLFIQYIGIRLIRLRKKYFDFTLRVLSHGRTSTSNEFIAVQVAHYMHCIFWFFIGTKLIYYKLFNSGNYGWEAVALMAANIIALLMLARWAFRAPE
jgi:hypothetical protein